jgi:hypothetical protein
LSGSRLDHVPPLALLPGNTSLEFVVRMAL